MKTLAEHQSERNDLWRMLTSIEPRALGIACPYCGHELRDPTPHIQLPTAPPKRRAECPVCFFETYLTA